MTDPLPEDESPTCACSNCGHARETARGEWVCLEDDQKHPADDACQKWEMPLRRDMNTGEPFVVQEVLGPPTHPAHEAGRQ